MLISLESLLKYMEHCPIKQILHIGAHECEERGSYNKIGVKDSNIIWVDANEELVNKMLKDKDVRITHAIVSDKDNEDCEFILTNNVQSSSLLELDTHLQHAPYVTESKRIKGKTITIDTLLKDIPNDINFVNMDIQGAELKALKGMTQLLNTCQYLYLEVNNEDLYKGCARIQEIDHFVGHFGFERVETSWTPANWGDAFYMKTNAKTLKIDVFSQNDFEIKCDNPNTVVNKMLNNGDIIITYNDNKIMYNVFPINSPLELKSTLTEFCKEANINTIDLLILYDSFDVSTNKDLLTNGVIKMIQTNSLNNISDILSCNYKLYRIVDVGLIEMKSLDEMKDDNWLLVHSSVFYFNLSNNINDKFVLIDEDIRKYLASGKILEIKKTHQIAHIMLSSLMDKECIGFYNSGNLRRYTNSTQFLVPSHGTYIKREYSDELRQQLVKLDKDVYNRNNFLKFILSFIVGIMIFTHFI
jgi:FkbM family methyltransferase